MGEGQMGNVGPSLRFHIRDDRDRRVPLGTVLGMRVSSKIPKGARQAIAARLKAEFRATRGWKTRVIVGTAVVFAALAAAILIPFPNFQMWTFAIPPIFIPLVFIWAGHQFVRQHYHRAILAQRFCPACAYRLVQLDADEDGCTVCPECGAAWRLKPA